MPHSEDRRRYTPDQEGGQAAGQTQRSFQQTRPANARIEAFQVQEEDERRSRSERGIPMTEFPELALSVRQPWAWAIIHAGKNIENRSRAAISHGLDRPGRIAIHASKGITRIEYSVARDFMTGIGVECPPAAGLLRGGIIGTVEIVRAVSESESPWFFGAHGLELRNPEPCEFIPVVGSLGLFKWERADPSIVPETLRWMVIQEPKPEPDRSADAEGLF
jgi:hypothetical protein